MKPGPLPSSGVRATCPDFGFSADGALGTYAASIATGTAQVFRQYEQRASECILPAVDGRGQLLRMDRPLVPRQTGRKMKTREANRIKKIESASSWRRGPGMLNEPQGEQPAHQIRKRCGEEDGHSQAGPTIVHAAPLNASGARRE